MKILILTDIFPPAFGPRMGYLCKYLKKNGIEYFVITENIDDRTFTFLSDDEHADKMDFYHSKKGVRWLFAWLIDLMFDTKNKALCRRAAARLAEQKFDLILCSAYRTFPLPAAARLARQSGLPLIVDLRDIIEQWADNEFISRNVPRLFGLDKCFISGYRKILLSRRNCALKQASAVTTVSPWHVETLKRFNSNTHLIYNGFDPELFFPASIRSPIFYITYTGRLMSPVLQDPTLLFQAVRRLTDEDLIVPDKFRIRWFVDEKSKQTVIEIAEREGLTDEKFIEFHDYVPATEIPKILNESAVLLLLANRSGADGPNGIMTTKFFEYLAVEKPILCVRGDEGCLESVINSVGAGLSAHSVDEVYDFIKTHYRQWLSTGRTISDAKREEIRKFSRAAQAGQFIELFKSVI
jgi:glycosyltransferase involved in cell wall biosynthesis